MEESYLLKPPNAFDFPFEPYDIQYNFMKCLYETIENGKLGIFESPTGTGKSLSIICGAIRWLKDHNNHTRELINKQISKLETQKQSVSANSNDWLSSQSKEIELTRQINELKLEQNKISAYDKKIEDLINSARKRSIKKWKKHEKNDDNLDLIKEEERNIEDEDILLEDVKNCEEESDELDDEEDKFKTTKIFICSRTHSQLSQFIGEILKSPFASNVRVASLASRQVYCVNPDVTRLKSVSLINEKCLDMQKQVSKQSKTDSDGKIIKKQKGVTCKCVYYKQTMIEDLRDMILTEVQDVEDLIQNSKEFKGCPYYASRLAAEDAEVILVPYNTILHKATREANGINLNGNVIIIDEAHNLLEAMGQMHNSELNYNQIGQALTQVKCYKQRFNTRFSAPNLLSINQLIFVLTKLQQLLDSSAERKTNTFTVENFVVTAQIDNYNMFKLTKFCKDSRLAQKVRSYSLKYPLEKEITVKPAKKGIKDFLSSIENKKDKTVQPEPLEKSVVPNSSNALLSVISFLESLTYSYNDGRIFIHQNEDKLKTKLQFLLLNPSQNFKEIVQEARSVIVAGGTMKPIGEFKERLFINSGALPERIVEFSCDHIIPPDNILPVILTNGANKEKLLFNYENRMSMGSSIKAVLLEACKRIQGGIVAFFPSYSYESWVWQQIKDLQLGRLVFREPQGSGSVDSVLQSYADAIKKPSSRGALLLSVVGGKLSEGLNFNDDLGRCIIVVGLPYANIAAPDLKEKMSYLDKTEGGGAGKLFYENLCTKAVNQSIGRAVRHKDDYAAILLMDERYNRSCVKNALPDWIKRSLRVCDFQDTFKNIDKFFQAKNKIKST